MKQFMHSNRAVEWKAIKWVVLLFTLTQLASAQVSVNASVIGMYDGNAFRNSLGLSDMITSPTLSLAYRPEGTNFNFFATAGATLLGTYTERRFFTNTLGASYSKPFGDDQENLWELEAAYLSRADREAYNFYDFKQLTGAIALKYYPDYEDGFMTKAGYRFKSRWYSTLTEYSNLEHSFYLQAAKFFETKTTLIGEMDFGFKQYLNVPADSVLQATSTGSGMMGRMSGGTMNASSSNAGTTQLSVLLRAAQSLSSSAGISLQYLRRWNPRTRMPSITIGGTSFQGDEELWDDPYGYEGPVYTTTLTAAVPWEITMRASLEYADKSYSRRIYLATDTIDPTGPNRADRRQTAAIELKKTLDDVGLLDGVTISAAYSYVRNQSNDGYYDYTSSAFSLGIEVGF